MKYVRTLVLCLVIMLTLGAIVTAGASAKLPEWGKCYATGGGIGGKYTNAACTVKAKGKGNPKVFEGGYEWEPTTAGVASESTTLDGDFEFETEAGVRIECHGISTSSGITVALSGSTTPLWKFKKCTANGDEECTTLSIGSFPEEIANTLEWNEEAVRGWNHPARLGFVERNAEPNPLVGLGFKELRNEAEDKPEPFFTPISCGGGEDLVGTVLIGGDRTGGNGVIGAVAPVNEMSATYTITYSESGPGIQSPSRFAHEKSQTLQAFIHNHWEPVAFVGELEFEMEEGLEIKATN